MRYLYALIAIGIGTILVLKTEFFLSSFGRIPFAEQKFREYGGSRLFYKMLGVFIIFGAFLGLFGFWEGILNATIGPLFNLFSGETGI